MDVIFLFFYKNMVVITIIISLYEEEEYKSVIRMFEVHCWNSFWTISLLELNDATLHTYLNTFSCK